MKELALAFSVGLLVLIQNIDWWMMYDLKLIIYFLLISYNNFALKVLKQLWTRSHAQSKLALPFLAEKNEATAKHFKNILTLLIPMWE